MMDVWDCGIGEDELFSSKVGSATSMLDALVERSLNGSPESFELQLEEMSALPIADSPNSCSENILVVPCDGAAAKAVQDKRIAPKILKKKSTKKDVVFKNLKKVTFEVERLVAEEAYTGVEKEDAKARMAMRLGATPLPCAFVNYKKLKLSNSLKEDRAAEAEKPEARPFINELLKAATKMKNKSNNNGKKPKNGKVSKKPRD